MLLCCGFMENAIEKDSDLSQETHLQDRFNFMDILRIAKAQIYLDTKINVLDKETTGMVFRKRLDPRKSNDARVKVWVPHVTISEEP